MEIDQDYLRTGTRMSYER